MITDGYRTLGRLCNSLNTEEGVDASVSCKRGGFSMSDHFTVTEIASYFKVNP
jgi:hypothetical protein